MLTSSHATGSDQAPSLRFWVMSIRKKVTATQKVGHPGATPSATIGPNRANGSEKFDRRHQPTLINGIGPKRTSRAHVVDERSRERRPTNGAGKRTRRARARSGSPGHRVQHRPATPRVGLGGRVPASYDRALPLRAFEHRGSRWGHLLARLLR